MQRGALFVYDEVEIRKRNKLPHWHARNGIYFVTYRLADSLPLEYETKIANAISYERKRLFNEGLREDELEEAVARFAFARTQPLLDRGFGSCILRREECAEEVMRCWRFDDDSAYSLVAECVMPNHVHVVFRLRCESDISDVVKQWKSITSHNLGRLTGSGGTVWQDDYYDVLLRDERQLRNTIEYVMKNPARAGLSEWKWTRFSPDALAAIVGDVTR